MTQYAYDPYVQVRQTNGLGVAGFIVSLIGLVVTGGILSPIGLIISLIALGRQPRGFAIAGVILGVLGSCGLIVGIILVITLGLAAIAAAIGVVLLSNPEKTQITSDMVNMAIAIEQYKEENKYVPAELGLLHLNETVLIDPWGNRYRYDRLEDGRSFDLVSAGSDATFDTPDDVRLSELDKIWNDQNIRISSDSDGGAVEIQFGNNSINIKGDEQGGSVTIDTSGSAVRIEGDDDGGEVSVSTQPASMPGP